MATRYHDYHVLFFTLFFSTSDSSSLISLSENVMNKFDQSRQDLRSSEKKRREVLFSRKFINFISKYVHFW